MLGLAGCLTAVTYDVQGLLKAPGGAQAGAAQTQQPALG